MSLTPLMQQYFNLKSQVPDAVLFFRMGDFYELFGDDAVLSAPILGITLTSRDKKSENPMPMAGVPFHSAQGYIQKLLKHGKKVAIAEQVSAETPIDTPEETSPVHLAKTKSEPKIVDRLITRIFTPAVQFEISTDARAKYLATLIPQPGSKFALALLEPSTGQLKISGGLTEKDLVSEPLINQISHFLKGSDKIPFVFLSILENQNTLIEDIAFNYVSESQSRSILEKQYNKKGLHFLFDTPAAARAAAILIQYVLQTQKLDTLSHLNEPEHLHNTNALQLGPNTFSHLDLEDLFQWINSTGTSMGARELKALLQAPFKDVLEIQEQQNAVKELSSISRSQFEALSQTLKTVYDLDRILGRVSTGLANPRDIVALVQSVHQSFSLANTLSNTSTNKIKTLTSLLKESEKKLLSLILSLQSKLKPEPPPHTREGGIFELGTHPELDHLIRLTTEGEKFLVELEMREREQTGITSLKVKYNRVFGYFIEVSSANLAKVPPHYLRKQTMVGGERFFTEELKKFEEEILTASSKQKSLEQELFQQVIQQLVAHMLDLKSIAQAVGSLDMLMALARLAQQPEWSFPQINESLDLEIENGRHPVVEQSLKGRFVANSLTLSSTTSRTLLITGPNMGGKSTFMRQIAQIIILGQMGAPIPASQAHWGVFESLFTRIGAHDAIAKGQSTFMVEMVELAHILNFANERSFVVLDEVGRGTSTFDGMAVASASLKHLHQKSRARILFATHYHELTSLEQEIQGIQNAYMKVSEQDGKLQFLYEIAIGRSSKSFGIHVAELAGIPKSVIRDAWKTLDSLESSSRIQEHETLPLFSLHTELPAEPQKSEIEQLLAGMNLDQLRPIEALNVLNEWKLKIKS